MSDDPRHWPEGKIADDDDGEIKIAIASNHHAGVVMIAFPQPVKWLGLSPESAREIAKVILAKADELDPPK